MKQSRRYLFLAVTGLILVIMLAITFVNAYERSKDFKTFMYGIQLFIFIVFTISYTRLYLKEREKSREENKPG